MEIYIPQKKWQKTTQGIWQMKNHGNMFAVTGYFKTQLYKTCFSEQDYRFQPTHQHPERKEVLMHLHITMNGGLQC